MPPPFAVRVKTASGWQDIAIQGATGPTGPQGAQGVQGIPGGTMGAAVARSIAASTTAIDVYGAWKGVALPTALTVSPSDAFTFGANWVAVKDAGWYDVNATVQNNQGSQNSLYASLSTSASTGDGDIANQSARGGEGGYQRVGLSGLVQLTAGQKVYLYAYSPNASPVNVVCFTFQIARVGGPQGQMEVYTQPDEPPVSARTGAIWVDTDAPPPSGGNVPAGGTTGQILTKTSNADGAVTWGAAPVSGITGQTYTMSGYAADRVLNASATTMNEIASVLATLIDDMKTAGLIKP